MSLRRRALFLAGLLAAVSCSDAGDPLGPDGRKPPTPEPANILQALDCTVTVSSRSLTCASAVPGTGAASGLIVGGQNLYVTLASTGMAAASDTFTFNATVENLLPQALGVEDNGTADEEGVRVFLQSGPNAIGVGGPIVVAGASGEEVFINGNRPYYQYDGGLETGETSEPRQWKFALNGATQFNFRAYVSGRVKYPQGWVDITPDSALLNVGETAVLADSVFDMVGRGISDNVTWSSSNSAVVTVTETSDSTAQIQGVSQGTAWIKAQSVAASVRRDSILVTVDNAPVLNLDSISAISNITMPVDSAHGMLANDGTDEPLAVSAGAVTTDQGGTATISANGAFTYLSAPGYSGLDTIRYTVTDGTRTLPGKAVVRVEDSRYWYVRAGASGDGRDSSPFGTLGAAQAAAVAGDTMLVLAHENGDAVNGAVTLKANQAVIGQGTTEPISRGTYNGAAITVLASGAAPGLTSTAAGTTITLATNNVIRGVGITAANGAAVAGTSFGTLFVRDAGVNAAGPALQLSTGAINGIFLLLSSTGSATTGLSLTDVTGSLASASGAISGSVGTAFHVSGGSADITYGGSITNASGLAASISGRTGGALAVSGDVTDNAGGISVSGISGGTVGFSGALSLTGSGVSVGSNTGGTISFTGASKTITTGTNAGVSLTGNTGATVSFGGGGLDVTTTSGAAFTATGGGTVTVTGAGNTVESTTGTAVTLNGVGTGTDGVNLMSVSANGAPNGIVLSGVTGAGLQVTGIGTTAGSGGTLQNTTSHAVSLGSMTGADSVSLKYMTVSGGNAGTAGIFGSAFGTLRVTGVSVSATGGPALSLATGTLNGGFSSLGSANSASNGVILTSTGGSFTAAAGSITGAASTAFAVASGAVSATIAGSISQANAAPVVAVSGGHNGALTFETGTVGATNGTGLQFNDADGTYAFNGTTTLNGGDAAIDITNSSTGSFAFGTGASVTSPTGSAFTVYGSSPTVAYNGNLTKGNAGLLVDIGEQPGGSVTFQTGTLSATAGLGISLSNADGTVAFNGTTTLNGGDAGVDVVSQSSGAISFGTGASIANASGTALRVQNGTASTNVAYAGSVTSSATGLAVHVEGVSGGSVTASGAISGTMGVLVQNNTGGTITFSGAKSLNTAANAAVTLATNTGATVDFTNGNNDVTTTTGAAFTATGGGTVTVSGVGSDISTGTGNAITLNGVTLGAGGMTFATLITGAALAPVSLTNVAVTSGSALTVGGGTIAAAAGTRLAVSGGSVNVNWAGTINQSTHNNSLLSVFNGHTGTLGFSGPLAASSGNGLQFDNADGTYNFAGTAALNGGDAAIDVTGGSGGTFSFGGGVSVTNPTNELIRIVSSAPTFTYSGAFSRTSGAGAGILAQNNTGGTITFNGDGTTLDGDPADVTKSLSTGASAAISLLSNAGTTFNFGGGMTLTTTSGAGFAATGGATALNVTGAGNTISSGTGTALNVTDTNIGASGLSFRSVSHSGGANGIVLSNTGTTNGLQVTGDGATAGTGGSIINTSGADGASSGEGSQGVGVYLDNTRNVSLAFMALSGHSNWGIRGKSVVNFTMNKTRITGTNGSTTATDEGSIYFTELTGTASITGSFIDGGFEDAVLVDNTTGTLNRITFNGDTIGSANNVDGDGLRLEASGGVLNATIQNTRFARAAGDMFQHNIIGTAVSDLVFQNNTLINGHPVIVSGGGGTTITSAESGSLTYNISGNTFRGAKGTALVVHKPFGGGAGNGTMSGRIENNTIGTLGAGTAGSTEGSGMQVGLLARGTHTTLIQNNQIYDYNNFGIYLFIGGSSEATTGLTHDGAVNATIRGNTTAELFGSFAQQNGIQLNGGTNTGDDYQICLDLGGAGGFSNNFSAGGTDAAGSEDVRIRQRQSTTVKLPGYAGGATDLTAVQSYLTSRNSLTTVAAVNSVAGGGFTNPGASCAQPS
jgi:hypothetical protein